MKRLILLLLILISFKGFSNHIAGGEITYTSLGGNVYQLKLSYYWDCIGGFNPGASQVIAATGCGNAINVTVYQSTLTPGAGVSVAGVCPGYTLSCKKRIDYVGTITLPMACNSWTFGLGSCCRGGSITNLTGGTGASYYQFATLNNVAAPTNNSPYFTAPPLPYFCLNQPACFNLGVVENDGHTLSYALVSAYQTVTTFVNYSGTYTGVAPISGITINAVTGQVNFTPNALGDFVVVVRVTEYDAMGNIVGTVMRDIQVVVINCSNLTTGCSGGIVSNPTAGTTSTLTPYNLQICEGVPFCFDINFTDPNPGDSVKFSSPNLLTALPGATYTVSYSTINSLTVHICWTPGVGTANSNTNFNVIIKDNACPVPGAQYYTYMVDVLPAANAGPDLTICGTQSVTINSSGPGALFTWKYLSGATVPVGPAFSCNPCQNPVVSPITTQTYVLHTNGAINCVNADTVVIRVAPDFSLTASANVGNSCLSSSVQFTSTVTPVLAGYTYTWAPSAALSSTNTAAPTGTYNTPGIYTYTLQAVSPLGCKKQSAPVSITILPISAANFSATPLNDTVLCGGGNVQLNVNFLNGAPTLCGLASTSCTSPSTIQIGTGTTVNGTTSWPAPYGNFYKNARHQFLYRAVDLLAAGVVPGKISSAAFFVNSINGTTNYPNYTIRMKCTSLATLPTTQAFETGLVQVYTTPMYNVVTGWNTHNFNQAYEWDGVSNIILETCYSITSAFTSNCITPSTLMPYNASKVFYSDVTVACGPATPGTSIWLTGTRLPNTQFGNCTSTQNPASFTYSWSPSTFLSSTTIKNPVAVGVTSNIQYTVTVSPIGTSACPKIDTVRITVTPAFTTTLSSSAPFCTNSSASTLSIAYTGTTTGVVTNTWTGPGITNSVTGVFDPSISGLGAIKVYVLASNNGCLKRDSIVMNVEQFVPSSFTGSIIPQCISNPTIDLVTISTSSLGVWLGTGVSGSIFDPSVSGAGTFTVTHLTNSLPTVTLCPSTSSIVVSVSSVVQPTISMAGPYCDNFAAQSMTATPLGGSWTSATSASSITSIGLFSPSASLLGNNQLFYTLTSGPCVKKDSIMVSVEHFVSAALTGTLGPYCDYNPLVNLSAIAQFTTGTWAGTGVIGNAFDPSLALTGNNTLIYTTTSLPTATLCPDVQSTTVFVIDKPEANILSDKTDGCNYPLYINYFTNSVSTGTVSWDFGDGSPIMTGLNVSHPYIYAGTYTASLTYIDNYGCRDTTIASFAVSNYSLPVASFYASPEITTVVDGQISFTNNSTVLNANTYSWDIAGEATSTQVNTDHLFPNSGQFMITLVATNVYGCMDTISKYITVNPDVVIYVPNSFTPGNADGLNDVFQIFIPDSGVDYSTFNISIFDRWGTEVFKSNDINKSWNGRKSNSGDLLKSDAYVYRITFSDFNRKDYEKVGHVTLLSK